MQTFNAKETHDLLPYHVLADYLLNMLADKKAGTAYAPERVAVPLARGGTLLLMPATDGQFAVTKLVTVHPGNSSAGLPSVQADVLLMEAATGQRLAMLDGGAVTARRTAALSLLAARLVAPRSSGSLLVVGAGTQARAHLEAFCEGLDVNRVYVASKNMAHAEELAAYARKLNRQAAVSHPEEVIEKASFIVTATTSAEPVLPENVRDDAFVAAVGAYRPDMAELPAQLVRRARLYVDTLEGARAEAGDLIQAGVDWAQVTQLEDAVGTPGRQGKPVVFKSVGHALWDLAAARLAWSKLSAPYQEGESCH
ncbi:MAG TPA: delta(1)-pyrroline-2-carboxylate reductase family protein [Chloroflexia bacterium]|nr:delta(1)-pyrroline-2-carboxylate reductase family protein [Chloroflexia bacterium]